MAFKPTLLFILAPLLCFAAPGYEEPWGTDADLLPKQKSVEAPAQKPSIMVKAAKEAILFHQNVLSKVDGPRSHFRPSSSQYMLLAMQKHGFVKGFFLGCDRLLRENDDEWVYRTTTFNGKLIKYDPPP
ncbi:MAG: membrane protein insertion efficiency factor YidD [Chlamydiales bacterium]|nr:membrane protein insertion efficiency factor YidD [Chlamydiales bacterium]